MLPLATSSQADTVARATVAPGPIRLDGNENPYGPSPSARQALVASAGDAARYADRSRTALMAQLAAHEGVAVSQIVLGTGSGELLKMAGLLAMTASARRGVIASRPTYEELPEFATRLGLTVRWVAADGGHRHDLPAMRAAIDDQTALVYVCNPNNPTGTALTRAALEAFVHRSPPR